MATKPKPAPLGPNAAHAALDELHDLALQSRAAAQRKIDDLAGDGVHRSLRSELIGRSDLARGYLMALSAMGVVTNATEGLWYEYITGQRDDAPSY